MSISQPQGRRRRWNVFASVSRRYFMILLLLILMSFLKPSESHGGHTHMNQPKRRDGREDGESLNFRDTHPIEDPLYNFEKIPGATVEKFLELCPEKEHTIPTEKQMMDKKFDRNGLTTCKHPDAKRNYRQLELFYLKEAQGMLKNQRNQLLSPIRGVVSLILFLVPLGMTIYLISVGHFYIGHLRLPYFQKFFIPKPDLTEGVKYNLFTWMKFLALPGNHPAVRSRDPAKVTWHKYNKDDEELNPKKFRFGTTFFKFRGRTSIENSLTEDEIHKKKKNMMKIGWDFVADRSTYDAKRHTFGAATEKAKKSSQGAPASGSASAEAEAMLRRRSPSQSKGDLLARRMSRMVEKVDMKLRKQSKSELALGKKQQFRKPQLGVIDKLDIGIGIEPSGQSLAMGMVQPEMKTDPGLDEWAQQQDVEGGGGGSGVGAGTGTGKRKSPTMSSPGIRRKKD